MADEKENEVKYDPTTGLATVNYTVQSSDKTQEKAGSYIAHDPENPAAFIDHFIALSPEAQTTVIKNANYGANLRARALSRAAANAMAEGPDKVVNRAMAQIDKLPPAALEALLAKLQARA